MSSILDALRKLEAAEGRVARGPMPPTMQPRRGRLVLAGVVVALLLAVGLAAWLGTGGEPAPVEESAVPQEGGGEVVARAPGPSVEPTPPSTASMAPVAAPAPVVPPPSEAPPAPPVAAPAAPPVAPIVAAPAPAVVPGIPPVKAPAAVPAPPPAAPGAPAPAAAPQTAPPVASPAPATVPPAPPGTPPPTAPLAVAEPPPPAPPAEVPAPTTPPATVPVVAQAAAPEPVPPEPASPEPAPPQLAAVIPAQLPPAAPAPPPPRELMEATPPRARVTDEPSHQEPPPPPAAVARAEPPPPVTRARAKPRLPAEEIIPPDVDDGVLERPPPSAPRIQISFLVYARIPERRMVWLSIDGGSLITLHEGEGSGGVEVARILPDRIHLRHGDSLFMVRTRN